MIRRSHTSLIRNLLLAAAVLCSASANSHLQANGRPDGLTESITLVVMDPLAGPLACDCVKGYAQRKYELLGAHLTEQLGGTKVQVVWAESLQTALAGEAKGQTEKGPVHLVIGKDSVIRNDLARVKQNFEPIAMLTGSDGSLYQQGVFVVMAKDPAATVLDLEGYTVLFGPPETDEKCAAPKALLDELGVQVKVPAEACASCSIAAKQLLELGENSKTAAVISSYAEPLLEGCGSVKKGDLKVVGRTPDVAFISAFLSADMPAATKQAIQKALLDVRGETLLQGLETKSGFVAYQLPQKKSL